MQDAQTNLFPFSLNAVAAAKRWVAKSSLKLFRLLLCSPFIPVVRVAFAIILITLCFENNVTLRCFVDSRSHAE